MKTLEKFTTETPANTLHFIGENNYVYGEVVQKDYWENHLNELDIFIRGQYIIIQDPRSKKVITWDRIRSRLHQALLILNPSKTRNFKYQNYGFFVRLVKALNTRPREYWPKANASKSDLETFIIKSGIGSL